MNHLNFILLTFLISIFQSCAQKNPLENGKIETYKNVNKQLEENQNKKLIPKADIDELEMEVNNGGFNQYFINCGQNSYETLIELKKSGKNKTAVLLKKAIKLINPTNLSEKDFIEKLQKREVDELYDDKISAELNLLDEKFYKYPDGNLQQK